MKMKLLLPFCLLLSMTMFGQSLTLGAVVYAMPLNGSFEFTLMAGGYQSQPQGQTQLNGFLYGDETFHIWKNGGSGECLTALDPNVPGAASTEQSGE
jgi:hypothetical protein